MKFDTVIFYEILLSGIVNLKLVWNAEIMVDSDCFFTKNENNEISVIGKYNSQPFYYTKVNSNGEEIFSKKYKLQNLIDITGILHKNNNEILVFGLQNLLNIYEKIPCGILLNETNGDIKNTWIYNNLGPYFSQANIVNVNKNGNLILLGFARPQHPNPGIILVEMKEEGEIIWNKLYEIQYYKNSSGSDIIGIENSKNDDIIFVHKRSSLESALYRFDKYGNFVSEKLYINGEILSIIETSDNGFLLIGKRRYYIGQPHIPFVAKLDDKFNIQWNFTEEIGKTYLSIFKTSEHNFIIGGLYKTNLANEPLLKKGYALSLSNNGTLIWKTRVLKTEYVVYGTEISPNNIVFAGGYESIVNMRKIHIPDNIDKLRFYWLDEYRFCGIPTFWNYTECVNCPKECVECIIPEICKSCMRNYKLQNGSCIKEEKTIISVTKMKCEGIMKINNCTCTQNHYDNGTHCIKIEKNDCVGLCDNCVNLTEMKCLKCKENTVSMKINDFVICDCKKGYMKNENSSMCILEYNKNDTINKNYTNKVIKNNENSINLWEILILILIIGILLITGRTLYVRWKLRNFQSNNTSEITNLAEPNTKPGY